MNFPNLTRRETKDFLRRPTTLAPNHPGTIPFLRGLYDELLPNFSSKFFNVGCDETWDLGRGQSKKLCEAKGKGRVYLDFLNKIHREVSTRDKKMMFWGDIILKYPKLISRVAKKCCRFELGLRSESSVCKRKPRNSQRLKFHFTFVPALQHGKRSLANMTTALANLRAAAKAGKKFGAIGFLNTDWGDGGHPQPARRQLADVCRRCSTGLELKRF